MNIDKVCQLNDDGIVPSWCKVGVWYERELFKWGVFFIFNNSAQVILNEQRKNNFNMYVKCI